MERVIEVTTHVAKAMRVEVDIEYKQGGKAVYNDPELCNEIYPMILAICGDDKVLLVDRPTSYGAAIYANCAAQWLENNKK